MPLLDDLLEKRGIKDISELSPQERASYEAIKADLNARMSVQEIEKFLEAEKISIIKAWKEIEVGAQNKTDLTVRLENVKLQAEYIVCEKLLAIFSGVEIRKKRGQKRVNELINHKTKK